MKINRLIIKWGLITSILIVGYINIVYGQTTIVSSGATSITAISGNKKINVTIDMATIESNCGMFPLKPNYGLKTVNVVHSIEISINGKNLFVPRSVFADLINPREASIQVRKKDIVLSIIGADGADTYTVCVYFNNVKVNRRTVASWLIPDKLAEDTYYWLNILKDE